MSYKSDHARAAAMIRAELKKHGIRATVRSRTASMVDAVDVTVQDCPPWVLKEVQAFVGKFQYGSFDGMTDCYNYDNRNDSIPQVKYAHVRAEYAPEIRQAAWEWLCNYYGWTDAPANCEEIHSYRPDGRGYWATDLLWRVLNGTIEGFWQKPRVRLAA